LGSSAALAAGEILHGGRELAAAEAEPLEQLAGRELLAARLVARLQAADHHAHRVVLVLGELGEILRELGDLHRLAGLHAAGGGADAPRDQGEQGRLPGAVAAQDAGALAGRDAPGDVVEDGAAAELDARVDDVDDVLAEPRRRQLRELDRVAGGRLVLDQLVRGVDAELRLRRARGRSAAQPRELLLHEVLPLRLGRGRHPVALDALQDVGGVAALERLHLPVVHLPRARAHRIQEPPVVRDGDERPAAGGVALVQVLSEPGDALHVEVVGRLVEEEHVPVAGQQLRERDAAALAAGEVTDAGVPVEVADEPGEQVADAGVARPLVLGAVADDGVADGAVLVERVLLVEHAHLQAAAEGDAAARGLEAAGEHAQQRRLAVAVAADDADAVAVLEPERDRLEHGAGGEGDADALGAQEMCHMASIIPHARNLNVSGGGSAHRVRRVHT
jgi:hypothetical protein